MFNICTFVVHIHEYDGNTKAVCNAYSFSSSDHLANTLYLPNGNVSPKRDKLILSSKISAGVRMNIWLQISLCLHFKNLTISHPTSNDPLDYFLAPRQIYQS